MEKLTQLKKNKYSRLETEKKVMIKKARKGEEREKRNFVKKKLREAPYFLAPFFHPILLLPSSSPHFTLLLSPPSVCVSMTTPFSKPLLPLSTSSSSSSNLFPFTPLPFTIKISLPLSLQSPLLPYVTSDILPSLSPTPIPHPFFSSQFTFFISSCCCFFSYPSFFLLILIHYLSFFYYCFFALTVSLSSFDSLNLSPNQSIK